MDADPDDETMSFDASTSEQRVIAQLAKFVVRLERFQIREHWLEEQLANNQRFNDERHALLLAHVARLEAGIPTAAVLGAVTTQLAQMYADSHRVEDMIKAVLTILEGDRG
jgi:hypothetical protein